MTFRLLAGIGVWLAAGAVPVVIGGPARAELSFCNDTQTGATVAIGYKGEDGWTSEGWWRVAPGECTTAVAGALPLNYYYWRAIDENGAYKAGDYFFCTSQEVFTIVGDTGCSERGYARERFSEVAIGEGRAATVRLTAALAPRGNDDRKAPEPSAEAAPQTTPEPDTDAEAEAAAGSATAWDFPAIKATLQGEWRDANNRAMTMLIEGDRLQDQFLGVVAASGSWRLAGTCKGAGGNGPVLLVTYDDFGDDPVCWVLEGLNDTEMQYRAVGETEHSYFVKE